MPRRRRGQRRSSPGTSLGAIPRASATSASAAWRSNPAAQHVPERQREGGEARTDAHEAWLPGTLDAGAVTKERDHIGRAHPRRGAIERAIADRPVAVDHEHRRVRDAALLLAIEERPLLDDATAGVAEEREGQPQRLAEAFRTL